MEIILEALFLWLLSTLLVFAILLLLLSILKYGNFLYHLNQQKHGITALLYKPIQFMFGFNIQSRKSVLRIFIFSGALVLLVFTIFFFVRVFKV